MVRGWQPQITINCAPAEVMLRLQCEIIERFTEATHFCDTPGWVAQDELSRRPMHREGLYSLEDWPTMPNFDAIRTKVMDQERWEIRVERFGILGHFLALVRVLSNDAGLPMPAVTRVGEEFVCDLDHHRRAIFLRPKDLPRSKIFLQYPGGLVEDFFEVSSLSDDTVDILHRVVTTDAIHYLLGNTPLSSWNLTPELIHAFAPLSSRKNVHELDKVVALVRILSSCFGGGDTSAYRYDWTIADAEQARFHSA